MKISLLNSKKVLVVVLLFIVTSNLAFCQWSKSSNKTQKNSYWGISYGSSISNITNDPVLSISGLQSTPMYSYLNCSAEFGHFFGKTFGFSLGVGYDSYKTKFTLDSYQSEFQSTDTEGEKYVRMISAKNIQETQNVGFFNIPLRLNVRFSLGKKMSILFKPGINYAIPVVKKYESTGTFTYKGYYAQYPVTLENLPDYGFPTDLDTKINGKLELQKHSLFGKGSIELYFNNYLAIGFWYSHSFSNLSAYNSSDTFQLSTETNQINSLMGGSHKVSYSSYGISLNFRFYK